MKDYTISLLADYYGAMLSDRALEAVRRYYDEDMSLSEIAEIFCVSRQAISETLTKSAAALREYESKLGLAKKDEALSDSLSKAYDDCRCGNVREAMNTIDALRRGVRG